VARVVQEAVVGRLIGLASAAGAGPGVKARAEAALAGLAERLAGGDGEAAAAAHHRSLAREIARFLERPAPAAGAPLPAAEAPPGPPIGGGWRGLSAATEIPGVPGWGQCALGGLANGAGGSR